MSLFLGIDTSNYTTSIALCGDNEINIKEIIDVKEGMRGIRQSDGVFIHLKTLPRLYDNLNIDFNMIKAVGVSTCPRPVPGSYMPVFTAGESFAKVIAKTLNVPLFTTSHQDGHIMAGIMSQNAYELLDEPFYAVHLSGGTSEILSCQYKNGNFNAKIIGGTLDISAGQLIDRVGVKLGLKFPCGKELDKLSSSCNTPKKIKISTKDGFFNLSGAEAQLLSMVETESVDFIAKTALDAVARTITKALNNMNCKNILFVGGVSSNSYIRKYFTDKIDTNLYFATPELSCDNAMGVAKLCQLNI